MTSALPRSIVFLDDEKSYVELMTQLLSENLGVPVLGYSRPAEALADLPNHNVAVIITDYSMPGMNGIEFLQRAHAICPQAAALMITGHQIELDGVDLSYVTGLREALFKPITWRTLATQVIRHWPGGNPPRLLGQTNPG
jgi:DNA-binding NtrC family response regulator